MNTVLVVCTDRGTHPSRELGKMHLTDSGEVLFEPWVTEQERKAGVDLTPHRGTIRLRCRTCRRDIPWNQTTARRIIDTLTAAGVSTVDASRV